ncbi:MAG TPA: universal stress protein [Gemmatimonadales bacterium]|jgi:nucleotide-binding universal stress UspA family protein|nr:universal stress protein [Gemmatimonadales bacterium]
MRHLLVPLDGSGFGESALWLAGAIAARTGRDLELVTVITPAAHPDITAALAAEIEATCGTHARAYLESQAEKVHRRFGIAVHTAVLEGEVPNAVSIHVRASPPELIVMSTHGRSGPSRFFLGSVADRLLRELHCPFVLVRPTTGLARGELPDAARVLVPLDGSPLAESVIDQVAGLCRSDSAELRLVRIVAPAEVFPIGAPMPLPSPNPNLMEARIAMARSYLERRASRLRDAGWRVECEVVVAWSAAAEVLRLAEEHRCDLIAIATRGHDGVQRMLLGSVADKVIRGATMPVLAVNPSPGAFSLLLGAEAETETAVSA